MPRGDRTGPWGQGPMTGKGAGNCSDNSASVNRGSFGPGTYRGFGRGRGFFGPGPRFGRMFGFGLRRRRFFFGRNRW